MAPVIAELRSRPFIQTVVVATGQHRHMLDQVLTVFGIRPDYDLHVMRADQSPTDVLASVVAGMNPVLSQFMPDWVLVQGDTTSVLAATLCAKYLRLKVAHVEAGLRTYDFGNPFPEELNRVMVDHACDLHFAPTERARQALLREGIVQQKVFVTGNTVVDALIQISQQTSNSLPISIYPERRIVLITVHRRESHGEPLEHILDAVKQLAKRQDIQIVFPVHPNPNIAIPVHEALRDTENVTLTDPLDYLSFVAVMQRAYLILTDSGGIQEEAPSLKVPVLVMRDVTERPEAIESGVALLVGTHSDAIVTEATRLLDNIHDYLSMKRAVNPFGDGTASRQIVDILCSLSIAQPERDPDTQTQV